MPWNGAGMNVEVPGRTAGTLRMGGDMCSGPKCLRCAMLTVTYLALIW